MSPPRFLSALDVRWLDDGHAELLSPFAYESAVEDVGRLEVPIGYVTDFASVPRLPIVFWLVGSRANKASVLHDWCYSSQLVSQADADAVFYEAARLGGVVLWAAWAMWAGLRLAGRAAYEHYTAIYTYIRTEGYGQGPVPWQSPCNGEGSAR